MTPMQHLAGIGRPSLIRLLANLSPGYPTRNYDVVGKYGRSKFIRSQLDQFAPADEKAEPPYRETDGCHELRLSIRG